MENYKIKVNGIVESLRITVAVNGCIEFEVKGPFEIVRDSYDRFKAMHPELIESKNQQDVETQITVYK